MVGLLDIAPSSTTVTIRGKAVAVPGVSAHGIAYLAKRFPEVRDLFDGKGIPADADSLFTLVPDAIAAIIACGTGHVGSPEAEQVAAGLTASEQLDALETIMDVTMPGGVGPFVERLSGIVQGLSAADAANPANDSGKDSGGTSQPG